VTEQSYFRCRWLHDSPDYPVELWSALDTQRYEVRKIAIWRDGRVGYATTTEEVGGTMLGTVPVPPLDEIAADPQFEPQAISQEAFEAEWRRRLST
jgi:Domain of unknown function (DUF6881)